MDSKISPEQIEALRQEHIGRLLLRAHRAFSELSFEKLRARGHEGLGITHTALLANLDLDGTNITVLADRAGITKQAMGHLVVDLEQKGYVQRVVDPTDRRATLIKFTDSGQKFLLDAYYVKQEIEAEYTAVLGAERMEELRAALTVLLEHSRQAGAS